MKILSFIVPSYNCERFLYKCINSFLVEEVLDKLDIIIVNDGSSDGTKEVALSYAAQYPLSVRVISQENKGHGGALNTGLNAAVGKYVKVVDADDWVESENLPVLIKKLEESESDVLLAHHYTVDISTGEVKKWMSYPEVFEREYSFEEIMNNWKSFDRSLTFHGVIYNTEFYKKNCIALSERVFYEDHEYATIPCCFARSVKPLNLFLYRYRIGDVSQSVSDANQLKRLSHTETVLERLLFEYKKLPEDMGAGKRYFEMKAQGLLLSYITTVMLVEKNKKEGRRLGFEMMEKFRHNMPNAHALALKQYKIFKILNFFGVSKTAFERVIKSKLYNKLRGNHTFD